MESSILKRARLYEHAGGQRVRCLVCERRCLIPSGGVGVCGNYLNLSGTLHHLGYGRISAAESRPIEIKPLFHYWPNSTALTFSNWGCNFYCPWCQNHHISFRRPSWEDLVVQPTELVKQALRVGDRGLCASFNEPTTLFDYLLDVFQEGKENGLYATMVTNCYLTLKALEELVDVGVDGWSIDIKNMPRRVGVLSNINHELVFRNARRILDMGGHVEMVYLLVTDVNDDEECLNWIISNHLNKLGPEIPLHINRYYPAHKWRSPPTSIVKLKAFSEKARREGVEYVYVGNTGNPEDEATKCPECRKTLIYRISYRVVYFRLDKMGDKYRCPRCGKIIPIRGNPQLPQ